LAGTLADFLLLEEADEVDVVDADVKDDWEDETGVSEVG
jgi:hypothetical protein